MKIKIAGLLVIAAALACGADVPQGIPKGSTEIAPGRYQYIDKDKKVWIYRMTPFGPQRAPAEAATDEKEPQADAAPAPGRTSTPFGPSGPSAASAPVTKATEAGDSIRFERPTPFGPYRWTRKKSELTADEKKIWESQQTSAPAQATKQ